MIEIALLRLIIATICAVVIYSVAKAAKMPCVGYALAFLVTLLIFI